MRRNYLSIAWKCLKDSDYRFATLAKLGIYNSMPDEEFLKRLYKGYLGKDLDLNNPVYHQFQSDRMSQNKR